MQVHARTITDETLAEIETEFSDGGDGVWIAPAFARQHGISAADEERLEEAVASTEAAELRVLLVEPDYADERFSGDWAQLVAWIQDDLGGDAVYVGWRDYDGSLALEGADASNGGLYVDMLAAREAPDDLVGQVEEAATLFDDGNAYELWTALESDERSPEGPEAVSGLLTALIFGGVVLVLVLAGVAVAMWERARKERIAATPEDEERFALPAAVLSTVRKAEDRSRQRQAQAEIEALGKRLVATDLETVAPAALAVWEQAMEHHEVARRVLEQKRTPADVVGALVLARRGEDACSAAIAGRSAWEPEPGCWFNPLHAGETSKVLWRDEADSKRPRRVMVPSCAPCARAVSRGHEPDDILDFVQRDRVVHYYRLDIGVWSRTGYGSLETDLLSALRGREG